MKTWITELKAICQVTGELRTFIGPNVKAPTVELANQWCQTNGLGYCKATHQLLKEIPCKGDTLEPDWDNAIDYEEPTLN